jgi:hypothetical protein
MAGYCEHTMMGISWMAGQLLTSLKNDGALCRQLSLRLDTVCVRVWTVDATRSTIFWNERPCSLPSGSNSKSSKQPNSEKHAESTALLDSCWVFVWLTLTPWRWRQYIPPKRRWTTGFHMSHPITLLLEAQIRHAYNDAFIATCVVSESLVNWG